MEGNIDGSPQLLNRRNRKRECKLSNGGRMEEIAEDINISDINMPQSEEDSDEEGSYDEDSDEAFMEDFRVNRDCFDILLERLQKYEKKYSALSKAIPLERRVAIAMYTLGSTGDYNTLSFLFGMSESMVGKILLHFCCEVCRILGPEFIPKTLFTPAKVHKCTQGFLNLFGLPQCFGAIDGRHFAIKPCTADSADYRNQKGWCSILLLALVDHRSRFLYINVCPGRLNDSEAYEKSFLKKLMQRNPILKNNAKRIAGVDVPVVVIGDSAFNFTKTLMKPYSVRQRGKDEDKKAFNDVLYKSRKVADIAFTQLRARFPRLDYGIDNSRDQAKTIIFACCILHNFLNYHESEIPRTWIENAIWPIPYRIQPESAIGRNSNSSSEHFRKAIATDIKKKKNMNTDKYCDSI